ncbi:MAG: DUF2497 domain-containing protein [Alphaproteobacteria bacterium]|nr:DUF2497 domain-containing protein [Alphaproteobacteria bacterium]
MAEVKTEQEPSIEEILESIRQIISDDSDGGAKPDVPGKPQQAPAAQQAAAAMPSPSSSPMDIAFEPASARSAAAPDTDVLELIEKIKPPTSAAAIEPLDKPMTTEKPMTIEKPTTANSNGLISAQTADAATEALSKLLAGSLVIEKDEPARSGKVTLEDLTLDLMKPMLKIWLDQNLPGIIEKLVQKEVEKLSRRALDR